MLSCQPSRDPGRPPPSRLGSGKNGLKEKEQTLDVAKRLEAFLKVDGYVVCTRHTGNQILSDNYPYTYANITGVELLVYAHISGSSGPGGPKRRLRTTLFEN